MAETNPMTRLLFWAALLQVEPGPLDAYHANLAATRVDVAYTSTGGSLHGSSEQVWSDGRFRFEPGSGRFDQIGTWSFDGQAEAASYRSTDAIHERARAALPEMKFVAGKIYRTVSYRDETELVSDGRSLFERYRDPVRDPEGKDSSWRMIQAFDMRRRPRSFRETLGPFRFHSGCNDPVASSEPGVAEIGMTLLVRNEGRAP
jgi:hypothetical protein